MNAEPVNAEPVNSEPVNSEPVNSEPVNFEPVNAEPVNSEPVNAYNILWVVSCMLWDLPFVACLLLLPAAYLLFVILNRIAGTHKVPVPKSVIDACDWCEILFILQTFHRESCL